MRLRVELERSLLSTAARRAGAPTVLLQACASLNATAAGLQRAWFCVPATLRTVADLAASLAARFSLNERHPGKLLLAAVGYTLPLDAALPELLRDGDCVAVTRPGSSSYSESRELKRARRRSGAGATGSENDSETSADVLLSSAAVPPLLGRACVLQGQPAEVALRSRSARRKSLKRARRRQLLDADAGTPLLRAGTARAPPLAAVPADAPMRAFSHEAAQAEHAVVAPVNWRAPVLLKTAVEESSTTDSRSSDMAVVVPDNQQERVDECSDELHAFERWISGEAVTSEQEDEPPLTNMSALCIGDVISYRLVELSAAGFPQVSPRRRGAVSALSSDTGAVVLVPFPDAARLGGLVSAARSAAACVVQSSCCGDAAWPCIASPYNLDGSLEAAFCDLRHVLRQSPPGELLHAAVSEPDAAAAAMSALDAAAALSASAAALAAARRQTSLVVFGCAPEQDFANALEGPAVMHLPLDDEAPGGAEIPAAAAVPLVTPRNAMRGWRARAAAPRGS